MLFAWGSSMYYCSKRTRWVGTENDQVCSCSISKVFMLTFWVGEWVTKNPPLCWRNTHGWSPAWSATIPLQQTFSPRIISPQTVCMYYIFLQFPESSNKELRKFTKGQQNKILASDFDLWAVVHRQFQRSIFNILLKAQPPKFLL